ncbi:AAA family ATPase [Halobacillus litoralis]|uniref:AAA family ATPase n=1 Tax=Halobacillus litoralis TaxID=45668 RepID=UPI00136F9DDF|nr:AAA family ATPase [Halobacillus litoralis]MYL38067.1 AAA family ATPase [Halobacillus litoralis]
MRAVTITMNAFGPYRDKQTVDFTTLGNESIFLITGPTGAGKTTIFDAMCFALYGRASGSDRDQDTLRSHFASPEDPTYVDYLFELRGRTYRVKRLPKQQKKKERGEGFKEEPARAELYQVIDEEERLLASKIKEVNDTIEELMGLDYEQFRKMIMIPQGEFRKLISENSKEREEILQRIFKTEFFAELTSHFKAEAKKLEEEMKQFEWRIEQEKEKIHWHPDHEEEEQSQELSKVRERLHQRIMEQEIGCNEKQEKLQELKKEVESFQENVYQKQRVTELFQEKEHLLGEQQQLTDLQPEINRLQQEKQRAVKAAEIRPYEKDYENRRAELEKWQTSLQQKEERRTSLLQEYQEAEEKYRAEEQNAAHRETLKNEWKKKQEEEKRLQEYLLLGEELQKHNKQIVKHQEAVATNKQQQKETAQTVDKLKESVKEAPSLAEKEYALKQKLENAGHKKQRLQQLNREWEQLKKLRKTYQSFMARFEAVKKEQQVSKEAYESALEEIRSHHAYTLSLNLVADTPCPVCGSSHHPQPAQKPAAVKSSDEIQRLKEAFTQKDQQLTQLQEEFVQVKSEGETQRQLTDHLFQELQDDMEDRSEASIQKAVETASEHLDRIKKDLHTLGEKRARIQQESRQLEELEGKMIQLRREAERLQEALQSSRHQASDVQANIHAMEKDGSFKTTDAEALKSEAVKQEALYLEAEQNWEKAQTLYQQKRDEWQQIQTSVEEGQSYVEEMKAAVEERRNLVNQTLDQFSFPSLEAYRQALKSSAELESIEKRIQDHDKRKGIVDERLRVLNQELEGSEKPNMDALHKLLEEKKEARDASQEQLNEIQVMLKQNKDVEKNMAQLVEDMGALAADYYDVAELAQLAAGDNPMRLSLERYVLASFLDEILVQANIRLDQMTDHRYQLIRSGSIAKRGAQSGLDLEVIDHHTGQQRSVRTLSGGEGFKTSLSLALGMADVVQSHAGGVQLDTLFIDEGFGTLDEISLEQAIGCLRTLQDGNRMLGIISHVSQLKEEIPAKLQVHSGPRGSSLQFVFQ